MRCKSCDYPLWNLSARACPECGAPFKPSEFEFTTNSVRFCCPHCAQAYYGTGSNGHLVPADFDCVSCGKHITMDECVLLPTEGVHEDLTKADQNPWLERKKLGTFKAWFATIGRSMTQPGRLIEATPETAPWGLIYATGTNLVFSIVGVLGVIFLAVAAAAGFGGGGSIAGRIAAVAGGLGVTLGSVLVGILICLLLWIVSAHGVLRITGGTAYPMRRTAQAICFSSGANALSAIPILGAYLSWLFVIWWIVAAIVMVARGQRVHGGRAAAAVLAFPFLVVFGTAGLIAFSIYSSTSFSTPSTYTPPPPAPQAPASRVADVSRALATYRQEHSDAWPFHAVLLVPDHLAPTDLVLGGGPAPSLYDISLDQYAYYGKDTADKFHEFIRKQIPEGVIAHRLGDFVFTYHGIKPDADPGLWIAVAAPRTPVGSIEVATFGGEERTFAVGPEFDAALLEQNALRRQAGLAPLPDPATILNVAGPTP